MASAALVTARRAAVATAAAAGRVVCRATAARTLLAARISTVGRGRSVFDGVPAPGTSGRGDRTSAPGGDSTSSSGRGSSGGVSGAVGGELGAAREVLRTLGGDGSVDLDVTSLPHVAIVTLNNPRRANALSCRMMLQLEGVVATLQGWAEGRAVILTGAGTTFCSGADLRGNDTFFTPAAGAAMNAVMVAATRAFASLPLITVAAIQGAAVGGGAELATAADFRVMDDAASLQFIHAARGLTPGWGGIGRLVELCGRKQALYLLASATAITPELAASLHLTDEIVTVRPDASIVDAAASFLAPLVHLEEGSAVETETLQHLKTAVAAVAAADDGAARSVAEATTFTTRWGGPVHMRAVARWSRGAAKPAAASGTTPPPPTS